VAGSSHLKADFNVYLDGTKLDGATKAAISGVRVYLTHSGASAFEIVVDDPELRWQDKPTFTECKEVKIELGIPGKMKKVFDGEVTAWRTELERAGPTVLVVRGLDRSHRLMRGHKTKTYAQASPIDCAQKIASAAGLTAKTNAGQPAPVKTFRIQANESDYSFLRKMAELEGYLFYVDGSDLHFERPTLSSTDDVTVTFGEDVKTFLPVANFRRPVAEVEVGAWDSAGKAALTGKAKSGNELWTVPGGQPGAKLAKFQGTKPKLGLVESQVESQQHADTMAKAALTRRNLEFLTAEVEVQGNPDIKPGAMVGIQKVGVYSGHYWVTEANHFFDAGGYNCIFYVARDKWGSPPGQKKAKAATSAASGTLEIRLVDDDGKPVAGAAYEVKLPDGTVRRGSLDSSGHTRLTGLPRGNYNVTFPKLPPDAWELS
jgi:Bacteriophage probable baseplate hub protein